MHSIFAMHRVNPCLVIKMHLFAMHSGTCRMSRGTILLKRILTSVSSLLFLEDMKQSV